MLKKGGRLHQGHEIPHGPRGRFQRPPFAGIPRPTQRRLVYRVFFTGFYRVLQGFTGFYWVKRDFTGYYWVLLGFAAVFFWVSSDVVGFERKLARLWTTKYCRLDVQWRYCDESERPLSVDSGGTGSAPPQMDCAMVVPVESSFTASCLVLRLVFHNHLFRSFISSSLELV